MYSMLALLAGLSLVIGCLHGLIKSVDLKGGQIQKILSPLLKDLEKQVDGKTGEVIKEVKTQLGKTVEEMPGPLKNDLESVLENGFVSLQNVFLNRKADSSFNFEANDATIIITNDNMQPFQLTSKIAKECEKIVKGKKNDYEKAKALFDWFEDNITYDDERAAKQDAYRNSKEVFNDRKGICGEMDFLYIVMAWYVGIKSAAFVEVNVDFKGKKVDHACVSFDWKRKKILVDPAYHTFDIKHKDCNVWSNEKTVQAFKSWN